MPRIRFQTVVDCPPPLLRIAHAGLTKSFHDLGRTFVTKYHGCQVSDIGDDDDSFLRGNKERDLLSFNLRTIIVLKELSCDGKDIR